ncbi:MAG: hypothetical protein OXD49_00145 [Candidatus Poribacteria bacterium]|nr:hypothetical protein [Candidatus Poribacteria bacterium]
MANNVETRTTAKPKLVASKIKAVFGWHSHESESIPFLSLSHRGTGIKDGDRKHQCCQ